MRIDLRASLALTLATGAVHAAAAVIFWLAVPNPLGAVAAVLTIILALIAMRDRTLLWGRVAPASLELRRESRILATLRDGTEIESQVSARRYVSRWMVVLNLVAAPWGQRTILITRDMLPAGQFRSLRLWSLWDALPAARPATGSAQDAR